MLSRDDTAFRRISKTPLPFARPVKIDVDGIQNKREE